MSIGHRISPRAALLLFTLVVVGVVALLALLSERVGGTVCPAIGWGNSLTIAVEGHTTDVDAVHAHPGTDTGVAAEPWTVVEHQGSTPPEWVVQVGMAAPESVTVRALTADGTVLTEQTVSPRWRRVGGSEECGGPMAADPVVLHVG